MIGSGTLAPASRLVGRGAAERGAALCEITKKNLMLMKMPRCVLLLSLSPSPAPLLSRSSAALAG